jgi:Protein of unknown function (DUF2884)
MAARRRIAKLSTDLFNNKRVVMQYSSIRVCTLAAAMAITVSLPAQAKEHDISISCNASSDYNVTLSGQSFVFEGNDNKIPRVVVGGGMLFINGKQASLSVADQKRIDGFESGMRLLVPESRQVITEAVNIAYDALSHVSASFSDNPEKAMQKYQQARAKSLAGLNDTNSMLLFNDESMESIVKPIVQEFVPGIVGHAVGFALKSIFSSEEKTNAMEARIDNMEKDLDERIDKRAKALEPLAETMCKRIQRMDVLDDSLEIRLPNGKPINFIDANKAD